MSNFCRRNECVKRNRSLSVAILFVFCLLIPSSVFAGPYADLEVRSKGRTDQEVVASLKKLAEDDLDAQTAAENGGASARAYVALRASLEGAPATKVPSIGKGPGDERRASSWLANALDRLHSPKIDEPEIDRPNYKVGPWITTLMWMVLGGLGGLAVFLLARYARLPGFRKRAKAMIEEEEPVRSADAWLEEANALIAQGRFREAVRCLYVAGLMRFDEAGVARFDRHQTNWEHLRRIEASPKRPLGAEIRDATGRFDRVWYGHLPATAEDASSMRSWYDGLVRRLAEAVPA